MEFLAKHAHQHWIVDAVEIETGVRSLNLRAVSK